MEGLNASIIPLSQIPDLNPNFRIDAEFFAKEALDALARIRARDHAPLQSVCERIQHPAEVKREYEDQGLLTVMAKDVRANRVRLSDPSYMPEQLRRAVSQNRLNSGDVLVTRTGANYGQAAPWKQDLEAFACADILVVRDPKVPSGYLSSFLVSQFGKLLVLRAGYGAGQPHIAPPYLANIPIPRFDELEERVDRTIARSADLEREAGRLLEKAEDQMVEALGLAGWRPPEPLTYSARASAALVAGRLDARFFAPRIQALLNILSKDGRSVSDVARPRREKFRPEQHEVFEYIEISDLDGEGSVGSSRLLAVEAPSRATWHVRPDDIITSTVRPIRRLSGQIRPEQDGYVCSSGFVVVEPQKMAPEVLLTYLRLPVICELLDLYASASMYPTITDGDVFDLPLPILSDQVTDRVIANVREARLAKACAMTLLEDAKRAVEIAVEVSEAAACAHLELSEGAH